ncbi:MAG: hypothetical protein Q9160_003247 [Pyrenula sp. 1 TL-2023]
MSSQPKPRPRPRPLLNAAIRSHSIPDLISALELARTTAPSTYDVFVNSALAQACRNNSPTLAIHILTREHALASALSPSSISCAPSIPLLETLIHCGYDINLQDKLDASSQGKRLLDWVTANPDLVAWLLEHGARVDGEQPETEQGLLPMPPPVMETCAAQGVPMSVQILRQGGAQWGQRSLHRAVESAAMAGVDPGREEPLAMDEEVEERRRADVMLRYLVEQQGLDVNAMDSEVPRVMYEGPPLNYAAKERRGAKVVRWLLEMGADPELKSLYDGCGALAKARSCKCEEVVSSLEAWERDKKT